MVYCVGLTGDIASGKTTVAKLFSKLGIEVFHADKISKELTKRINLLIIKSSNTMDQEFSITMKNLIAKN